MAVDAPRLLARERGTAHQPVAPGQPRPVLYLAVVGAALIAFELFVLGKWVTGPNFESTPTGPDQLSTGKQALFSSWPATRR